jgi:hypothetical protein
LQRPSTTTTIISVSLRRQFALRCNRLSSAVVEYIFAKRKKMPDVVLRRLILVCCKQDS